MYSVTVPGPKIRDGCRYYELLSRPCLATASLNAKEKIVYNGHFVIDAIMDSWKFGCELQFNNWCFSAPSVRKRSHPDLNYFHVEPGRLPLTHETADLLRTLGDQIDMLINYSEPVMMYSVAKAPRVFNEKSNLAEMLL